MTSRVVDASVIILASRPPALERCLRSLAAARPRPREVLLVLNGRDPGCEPAAAAFLGRLPGLSLLDGGRRSLGAARNMALERARGRWLCFLDDDVTVPPGYFTVLEGKIRLYPGAAAIGGPNLTPPGSPAFERCAGHFLGSPPAVGRLSRRYAGHPADAWTDDGGLILCNLCLDADVLREEGLRFDEELVRNEENLLLQRLLRAGRRALHAPALRVFHERRSTWRGFARQCFLSGRGRAEMTAKLPGTLRPVYLLPLLPALCAAGALLLPRAFLPWAAAYGAWSLAHAQWLRRRHGEGLSALWLLAALMPVGHLSYAAGLAAGALARARAAAGTLLGAPRGLDREARALIALGLAYGALLGALNVLQLRSFFSFEYEDSALESQLLYNLATAGRFVQTLYHDGGHDHFWPIALLLAPFYRLHPGIETWFLLRSFSYGLCAVPLYLIARERLSSRRTALLVGLCWLAYAPLQYLVLGAVDGGRNFALPLLVWALFFQERRMFRSYCAALLLVCACKEDMPLVGLGLGAWQYASGMPRRWWRATLGLSSACLAVSRVFLGTTFRPWPRQDGSAAGFFYLDPANAGRLAVMLREDWRGTLGYAFHPSKLKALFLLGWPLLFLPLLSRELLVPASAFAVFLLARPRFYNQNGDYLAPILPFVFLALTAALAKAKARWGGRAAEAAAALVLALCLAQQGTRTILGCTAEENETPGRAEDPRFKGVRRILDPRLYRVDDEDRRALALARRIPRDASVTASGSFLPLLSGRRVLHQFGACEGVPLKDRRRREALCYSADVVLLDRECRSHGLGGGYACLDPEDFRRELDKLVKGYRYRLLEDDGTFVLLSTPLGPRHPRPLL